MKRVFRQFFILVCAAVLGACSSDHPDQPFQTYLERLGRTLEQPLEPPPSAAAIARLPRPGQLRQEVSPGKLGTLDFMDLRGCALQTTIGKANSSLGRMARDSQRLLLTLEFLRHAPDCIDLMRGQGET